MYVDIWTIRLAHSVMPKMKRVSLAMQTRRVTTRSQTYREHCARRGQDNMDGANTSEPTACLQSASSATPTTQQHVPTLELTGSAVSVFSTPETNSFQHTQQYAPRHTQFSSESSVLNSTVSDNLLHAQQYSTHSQSISINISESSVPSSISNMHIHMARTLVLTLHSLLFQVHQP